LAVIQKLNHKVLLAKKQFARI